MKKRLLSGLLSLLLALTLCPPASGVYTDVPQGHWAQGDIAAATDAGIFAGVSASSFGLGQVMTRAQFAAALVRLFGWTPVAPAAPSYRDCAAWRWYYSAVETARANGAVPGYSTAFRPTAAITREEMTTMLVRALGYTHLAGAMSSACPFSDVTSNRGYIAVAFDMGIISGHADGTFRPRAAATREQAAAVLMRVYRKLHGSSSAVAADDSAYAHITVATPEASADTAIPTTPLEPLDDLYRALLHHRQSGADMDKLAVVLTAGGVATTVRGSRILSSQTVSASRVKRYLASSSGKTYYSDQYESAYLILPGAVTTTVWYQSEDSLAAKLQLCRMFGVTHYILQDAD